MRPTAIAGNSLGVGTEFRRAFLGFEGTLPGEFGYRIEADLANSSVELTDVYLTYKAAQRADPDASASTSRSGASRR